MCISCTQRRFAACAKSLPRHVPDVLLVFANGFQFSACLADFDQQTQNRPLGRARHAGRGVDGATLDQRRDDCRFLVVSTAPLPCRPACAARGKVASMRKTSSGIRLLIQCVAYHQGDWSASLGAEERVQRAIQDASESNQNTGAAGRLGEPVDFRLARDHVSI
jgi:hypothetical protein